MDTLTESFENLSLKKHYITLFVHHDFYSTRKVSDNKLNYMKISIYMNKNKTITSKNDYEKHPLFKKKYIENIVYYEEEKFNLKFIVLNKKINILSKNKMWITHYLFYRNENKLEYSRYYEFLENIKFKVVKTTQKINVPILHFILDYLKSI